MNISIETNIRQLFRIQVKWSSVMDRSLPETPTAVFLHGILGCRKNWGECYSLCINIMCTIVVLQQCIPPDQTSLLCVLKTHIEF